MNAYKQSEVSEETAHQKYKERISQLQFHKNPSTSFHLYEGCWYASNLLEGIMSVQDKFHAKPTDILLSGSLKAGTTWLKALSFAIVTRNKYDISSSPLLTTTPQDCIPFLEIDLVPNNTFQRDPELPLLSTHIPYKSLPSSIITSGCKIVYIYRDPKDVFVSLWHFLSKLLPGDKNIHGLRQFLDLFVKGISPYGPFWGHVLSYWEASLERPGEILLLKYEDLMTDTKYNLNKLANFVGFPFSAEEEKDGVVEKIVNMCDFENLSNLDVNKKGKYRVKNNSSRMIDNNTFFRKGQIGDWKNYLTPDMTDEIDKTTQKYGGGLLFPEKSNHYFFAYEDRIRSDKYSMIFS